MLRHILYLVCLYPCLCLGLLMSYLYNLFLIFSLRQIHLFFVQFLQYLLLFLDDKLDEETEKFTSSKISASGCYLAFAWIFCQFQPCVAYKSVIIQKMIRDILKNVQKTRASFLIRLYD